MHQNAKTSTLLHVLGGKMLRRCAGSSLVFMTWALLAFSMRLHGQTGNACDLNQDGAVNSADVQVAINMNLGQIPCTANIAGANVCNIVVVQRIINAASGGSCLTSTGLHTVALSWAASTSSGVTGYKVYRGTISGGAYRLVASVGITTAYTDTTVVSGQTYYYVVTAVDDSGNESSYSTESKAVVPVP